MPELTEEQKDHLCAENVVYEYTDHLSLHAYAPFAQQNDGTLVVDLVWDEDVGGWAYFNTKVIEATIDELKTSKKFIGISKTTAGARDALIRLADSNSHKEKQGCSDDDYWGQFEGPEAPSSNDNADLDKESVDSYWDKYGDNSDGDSDRDTDKDKEIERQESRLTIGVLPDLESKELVVRSIRLSLAAAASSARAAGVLEAGFLEMAHLAFNASQ
ncbi:hypothetical protein J3B02_004275 [Coemansia erecta]|nr:hypothetical protein J3B02_004275 [Coemansia erecta]